MNSTFVEKLPTWSLLLVTLAGSYCTYASVFSGLPFDLFWGFVIAAVMPALLLASRRPVFWYKAPAVLSITWCLYLAIGSRAMYL